MCKSQTQNVSREAFVLSFQWQTYWNSLYRVSFLKAVLGLPCSQWWTRHIPSHDRHTYTCKTRYGHQGRRHGKIGTGQARGGSDNPAASSLTSVYIRFRQGLPSRRRLHYHVHWYDGRAYLQGPSFFRSVTGCVTLTSASDSKHRG